MTFKLEYPTLESDDPKDIAQWVLDVMDEEHEGIHFNQATFGMWIHDSYGYTPCGTSACVAGHVVLAKGYEPILGYVNTNETYKDWIAVEKDGKIEPVRQTAKDLLGLNQAEAGALFDGANQVWAVRLVLQGIVDGKNFLEGLGEAEQGFLWSDSEDEARESGLLPEGV